MRGNGVGRTSGGLLVGVVLLFGAVAAIAEPASIPASAGPEEGADAPKAETIVRSRDTLAVREMILVNQVGFARGTARWRAREIYRLLQDPVGGDGHTLRAGDRARAVVAGLNAFRRDRQEQAALASELAAVRGERAVVARATPTFEGGDPGATGAAGPALPAPAFVAPVDGSIASAFGPAREPSGGVWLFHPGVRWRVRAGDAVRAPEAGVVRRIADSDGRRTIVLQHAGSWITIVGGLHDVTIGVGQTVTRGQVVAHASGGAGEREGVTLEIWHRRVAIDPVTVLRR